MQDDASKIPADANATRKTKTVTPGQPSRRSFMTETLAVLIGGVAGLFPLVVGLVVFFDPLRSRRRRGKGNENAKEGFIKVTALDVLLVGKPPQPFPVIDDLVDAWNLFPQETIGQVFLARTAEFEVRAFNRLCPHAGCYVDFDRDRDVFQCPCHNSAFAADGSIHNDASPAARGLDSLEVDQDKLKEGEVWVKFQTFRSGTAKKIAET